MSGNNGASVSRMDDEKVMASQDLVTKEMKLEFCGKVKKLSNKGLASLVLKVK